MVMDDVGRLFRWIFGRFIGPKDEAEPDAGKMEAPPVSG
jgi:hypothetical protein